ncbi:glia-derived nexin isoform X1 [Alligator mississippiensis]|uniref:Glia-derived nexin isoform X1 n=1 Tax=Alligator sinensis TaxID=38654 RepID=A0A1U7RBL7_ALLSI|nr:glia-derived nexin isoform X1 [Alligator sinensis]XP_006276541.1 glia-derived nexin isoform X1 [Alligator mississippiensis]XP_025056216.1 glia-derived nexin isoform X1 [Alligator sinensis]
MNWHFLLLCAAVTLTSVCSQFNFPLEELGSDVGIQVFNQIVKARPQENIVVSPHGIASVLGVLQLGADGKTKKQLTTVMRYSLNAAESKEESQRHVTSQLSPDIQQQVLPGPPVVHRLLFENLCYGVGKALKKINKLIVSKKNKDIVTIANAVFAKSGFKMEVPFVTRNKEVFQCNVKSVDFEDPNVACDSINQWVKNETRGMIDKILSPDDIDAALTRLVLVNAVYFKGLWKSRFRPENTRKRPFYGADGKTYQVPMLSQLSVFRCGTTSTPNDLWYNIIELPYHGEMISMLIAVPSESTTLLSSVIPHISTKTIESWRTIMVPKRVQVTLPKFTAEAETDLKEPLKSLGITDMFEQAKANFAKITRTESLHVSQILQKTKIEVSEDGTKAAAATTAILIARSSPPWFIVDRPFVFFIRHNPTGAVLFMGQINKP